LTGTGFSFLCSVFSKEIGFTLPVILILFDFLFLCKTGEKIKKRLKIYLPLLLAVTIYIAFFMRGGLFYQFVKGLEEWRWTPWENLLTQSNVIIQYIKLLFLPLPGWLNIDHNFQVSTSLFEYPTYISAAIIVLLLVLALFLTRKNRLVSFSIFWFFVVLAPTSSVIPIWDIMVEYRLYLPLLSYAFLLALAVHYLFNFFRKYLSLKLSWGLVFGLSCLLLAFYSHVTIHRNYVFKDELTVWTDSVKKSPYKMRVRHNLGRAYFNKGLIDDAIREGEIALELSAHIKNKTNVKFILNLLGGGYFRKGENEKALDLFRKAAEIDPDYATSYYNMSCVYAKKNEKKEALKYLRKGISLNQLYKEKARVDRDFDLLRGDKEFEKLLE
jgi:tetratricopeptide (TPR) repeat protein